MSDFEGPFSSPPIVVIDSRSVFPRPQLVSNNSVSKTRSLIRCRFHSSYAIPAPHMHNTMDAVVVQDFTKHNYALVNFHFLPVFF